MHSLPISREPSAGILTMQRRDVHGIIAVWGWGSWTPDYTDAHFAELGRHIAEVRAAGLPVRVMVNLQKTGEQSHATIDRIRAGADAIYRPGDRIALIVGSSQMKAQMSRLLDRTKLNFFISETAAKLWLAPDLCWQRNEGTWTA
jgi:hypothetical protein